MSVLPPCADRSRSSAAAVRPAPTCSNRLAATAAPTDCDCGGCCCCCCEPRGFPCQEGGFLPEGWKRIESTSQPGKYYYVSPMGNTQWQHPGSDAERASASAAVQRDAINSLYRVNYKKWDNAGLFNPDDINRTGGKSSKSYALHPKAPHDDSFFKTLYRTEYVDHHPKPQVHHKMWPVPVTDPFHGNSTYRTDFSPFPAKRPKTSRPRSPPRTQPFAQNSTNRADFVDFHPKRPHIVKPEHKLHFNMGTTNNSLYRQDFVDHTKSPMFGGRPLKLSRFHEDEGWKDGLNRPDAEHYRSLYQTDYVEGKDIGVPPLVRRNSQVIDRDIMQRQKAIAGLGETAGGGATIPRPPKHTCSCGDECKCCSSCPCKSPRR